MKKIAALLAGLALGSGASAGTVSFSFSNPETSIGGVFPGTVQTGNLGLFDSNLGTLSGALLSVTGSATAAFGIANVSDTQQTAALTHVTSLVWRSSLALLDPWLADSMTLTAGTGSLVYDPGQARSFGPTTDTLTYVDDLEPMLGALQASGGGAFRVDCSRLASLQVDNGSVNAFDVFSITRNVAAGGCGASITYTYEAAAPVNVPEPTSLALAVLALAGVSASRRRQC